MGWQSFNCTVDESLALRAIGRRIGNPAGSFGRWGCRLIPVGGDPGALERGRVAGSSSARVGTRGMPLLERRPARQVATSCSRNGTSVYAPNQRKSEAKREDRAAQYERPRNVFDRPSTFVKDASVARTSPMNRSLSARYWHHLLKKHGASGIWSVPAVRYDTPSTVVKSLDGRQTCSLAPSRRQQD